MSLKQLLLVKGKVFTIYNRIEEGDKKKGRIFFTTDARQRIQIFFNRLFFRVSGKCSNLG